MKDPYDYGNDGEQEEYEDSIEDRLDADAFEDEELPFGISGVTGLLDRLDKAVELGTWSSKKCRMVAEYVLSISDEYWLSTSEVSYCRRLLV